MENEMVFECERDPYHINGCAVNNEFNMVHLVMYDENGKIAGTENLKGLKSFSEETGVMKFVFDKAEARSDTQEVLEKWHNSVVNMSEIRYNKVMEMKREQELKEKQNDRITTGIASDGLTMEAPARNFRFRLNLELGDKKYDVDKSFTIGSTTSKYLDIITKRAEMVMKRVEEGKDAVLEEIEKAKNTELGKRTMEVSEKVSSSLEEAMHSDTAKNFVGVSRNVITHPVNTTVAVAKVYRDYVKSIVMRPASYMAEKVLSFSDRANEKVKEAAEHVVKKSEEVKQDLRNSRKEYVSQMGDGYVRSERQSDYDISQAEQYVSTSGATVKVTGKAEELAGKGVEASGKATEDVGKAVETAKKEGYSGTTVNSQGEKNWANSNPNIDMVEKSMPHAPGSKSMEEAIMKATASAIKTENIKLDYHSDIEGPRMSIHNGVSVATFRLNENMVTGARGEKFIEPVHSSNHGDVEKSLSLTMYHNNGEAKQYVNIPGLVGFSKKDDKTYIAIRTTSTPIGDGKYHGGATLNSIEMTLKRFNEGIRSYWNNINRKRNAAKSVTVISQENRPVNRDKSKGM